MKKILSASILLILFLTTFSFAAELLFLSDFETGDIQPPANDPDGWTEQSCYPYSVEVVTSPVRAGNHAVKIYLKVNDDYACFGGGYQIPRSQLVKDQPSSMNFDTQVGQWFAYSIYYPDDWPTTGYMSVMSVYGNLYHKIRTNDEEFIHVRWGTGPGQTPDGTDDIYTTTLTRGVWTDWIFYYYPSWGSDGVLKIWRNGVKIIDRNGANCIEGYMGWSNVRIKLYGNDHQEFAVYFDEFRMARGPDTQEYRDLVDPAQGGSNDIPTVTSQPTTDITHNTGVGHGTITATGGVNATKRGICWNTTGSPTVASDKVEESGTFGVGTFVGNLTSLTPDLRYFAKAYAMNTIGYGYGSQVTFDTVESGTYIIDNGDTGTSSTGNWYASGGANPYGIDSLTCSETSSTYTFEKTLDGEYTVSLWWTYWSSRSDNITVRVYDSGDNLLATENINQQLYGGQWNELDTYDFNATAKVVITSTGGSPTTSTCADAIRFVLNEGIIRQFMMMMGM